MPKPVTAKQSILLGIIGIGMVGGALERYFRARAFRVYIYDNHKALGSPAEVNKAKIVFVCVPTPYSKKEGCDLSAVEKSVRLLQSPKVVVIRSTVLPGTTEKLQKKYPMHRFLFVPEFLTESKADYDTRHPARLLLGYTKKSKHIAAKIQAIFPRAKFTRVLPATEAEFVKYFSNTFYATKVVFVNQFYDVVQRMGADYDSIRECVEHDPMIAPSHLMVWHKGYRGFGGKCLPKDLDTLIHFGRSKNQDMVLLRTVKRLNNNLQRKQRSVSRTKSTPPKSLRRRAR